MDTMMIATPRHFELLTGPDGPLGFKMTGSSKEGAGLCRIWLRQSDPWDRYLDPRVDSRRWDVRAFEKSDSAFSAIPGFTVNDLAQLSERYEFSPSALGLETLKTIGDPIFDQTVSWAQDVTQTPFKAESAVSLPKLDAKSASAAAKPSSHGTPAAKDADDSVASDVSSATKGRSRTEPASPGPLKTSEYSIETAVVSGSLPAIAQPAPPAKRTQPGIPASQSKEPLGADAPKSSASGELRRKPDLDSPLKLSDLDEGWDEVPVSAVRPVIPPAANEGDDNEDK